MTSESGTPDPAASFEPHRRRGAGAIEIDAPATRRALPGRGTGLSVGPAAATRVTAYRETRGQPRAVLRKLVGRGRWPDR